MWDAKPDSELYRTYCPNCGDRLIGDSEKGEQVCQACGYVAAAGRTRGRNGRPSTSRKRASVSGSGPR